MLFKRLHSYSSEFVYTNLVFVNLCIIMYGDIYACASVFFSILYICALIFYCKMNHACIYHIYYKYMYICTYIYMYMYTYMYISWNHIFIYLFFLFHNYYVIVNTLQLYKCDYIYCSHGIHGDVWELFSQ